MLVWQATVHPYQFARLHASTPLGTGFHGDCVLFKPNAQYSGQVSYSATSCCCEQRKSGAAQENTESGRCGSLMVSTGPQVEVWRTPLPQLHLSPSFMEEKVIALAVTSISRDPARSIWPFVFSVLFEMSHLQVSQLISCRERMTGTMVA